MDNKDTFPKTVGGDNPELIKAKEKAEKYQAVINLEEVIKTLGTLKYEIISSKLAKRFDKELSEEEKKALSLITNAKGIKTEEDRKKNHLVNNIENVESGIIALADKIRQIVLDFEASKID